MTRSRSPGPIYSWPPTSRFEPAGASLPVPTIPVADTSTKRPARLPFRTAACPVTCFPANRASAYLRREAIPYSVFRYTVYVHIPLKAEFASETAVDTPGLTASLFKKTRLSSVSI